MKGLAQDWTASRSVRAAVSELHRRVHYKQQKFINNSLTVLEAGKPKIKVLADSTSGEGLHCSL